MLRHSVSQIFSPHPAFALRQNIQMEESQKQFEWQYMAAPVIKLNTEVGEKEKMSSELLGNGLALQQHTPIHQAPPIHLPTSVPLTNSTASQSAPRNQIEAMPPTSTTTTANLLPLYNLNGTLVLDPATRHPVFFTNRLKKAPEGVLSSTYSWGEEGVRTPVARGYVFECGVVEVRELKL